MAYQSQNARNTGAAPDRAYTREGLNLRERSLLAALPPTERDIVLALKLHGASNIIQLSERLEASPSALRPHLGQLESEGIVTHRAVVKGPGRPQYTFSLTSDGEELFPTAVGRFGVSLVRFLAEHNPQLLRQFAAANQAEYVKAAADILQGLDYEQSVEAIVAGLQDTDFLPEMAAAGNGALDVSLHHCPLLAIAAEFPFMCEYERAGFEQMLPEARVTRTAHRIEGAPICVYRFANRSSEPEADVDARAAAGPGERLVF